MVIDFEDLEAELLTELFDLSVASGTEARRRALRDWADGRLSVADTADGASEASPSGTVETDGAVLVVVVLNVLRFAASAGSVSIPVKSNARSAMRRIDTEYLITDNR